LCSLFFIFCLPPLTPLWSFSQRLTILKLVAGAVPLVQHFFPLQNWLAGPFLVSNFLKFSGDKIGSVPSLSPCCFRCRLFHLLFSVPYDILVLLFKSCALRCPFPIFPRVYCSFARGPPRVSRNPVVFFVIFFLVLPWL